MYYNVIIGFFDESGTSTVSGSRFYLPDRFSQNFSGKSPVDADLKTFCMQIPTVFSREIGWDEIPMAYIGWITNISQYGRDLRVEYDLASGIAPIPADQLAQALSLTNLRRQVGEMQHSHWTIKEGDVFRTASRAHLLRSAQPSIFAVPKDCLRGKLVSVMMPFKQGFNGVFQALESACSSLGLECKRADDIWEHSTIIQDIFSLIYRSKIIICDFSEKNPNVFYEAGIGHALGKDVIPIVQYPNDIPFDLQHHRYIQYQNNAEGLQNLVMNIKPRLETLTKK